MENVNAKDRNGHTQLICASKQGQLDSVKDLLHRGADITASSDKGKTALHYAAANGKTEIVKMLIEKGAEVDARDRDGHTPLMLAAIYGCNLTVQALLEGGADPRAKTKCGNTAVLYAENNSTRLPQPCSKKQSAPKQETPDLFIQASGILNTSPLTLVEGLVFFYSTSYDADPFYFTKEL